MVLKRVLLAYARWNKNVGYCQGFNILAALILEVMEGNEGDALKVSIRLRQRQLDAAVGTITLSSDASPLLIPLQ